MRKLLLVMTCVVSMVIARGQQSEADAVATKLADRMKDSLDLSGVQRDAVYNANLWLHVRKAEIWQAYPGSDSLRVFIQRVENKRDSLYQAILPQDKFLLYQARKVTIINNN